MIKYQAVNYRDCIDEIKSMFESHYDELSVTKGFRLNPDYEIYESADKRNTVKIILCKDDEKVIGYIVFFVGNNLHYKDCLLATEDIYYLLPEYRRGRIAIKMFNFAEDYLKSIGVNMIRYTTKVHMDNSALFEYLDYNFIEKVFVKRI